MVFCIEMWNCGILKLFPLILFVCVSMCAYVCACMCVCVRMCVCVYGLIDWLENWLPLIVVLFVF